MASWVLELSGVDSRVLKVYYNSFNINSEFYHVLNIGNTMIYTIKIIFRGFYYELISLSWLLKIFVLSWVMIEWWGNFVCVNMWNLPLCLYVKGMVSPRCFPLRPTEPGDLKWTVFRGSTKDWNLEWEVYPPKAMGLFIPLYVLVIHTMSSK